MESSQHLEHLHSPNRDLSDRGRELALHMTIIQFKINASSLSISHGRSSVCRYEYDTR